MGLSTTQGRVTRGGCAGDCGGLVTFDATAEEVRDMGEMEGPAEEGEVVVGLALAGAALAAGLAAAGAEAAAAGAGGAVGVVVAGSV